MKTIPKDLTISLLNSEKATILNFEGQTIDVHLGDLLLKITQLNKILHKAINSSLIDSDLFRVFLAGLDPNDCEVPDSLAINPQGELVAGSDLKIQKETAPPPTDDQLIEEYNSLITHTKPSEMVKVFGRDKLKYLIEKVKVLTVEDIKHSRKIVQALTLENISKNTPTVYHKEVEEDSDVSEINLGEIPALSSDQLKHYNDVSRKLNQGLILGYSEKKPAKLDAEVFNPFSQILLLAEKVVLDKETDSLEPNESNRGESS